MALIGGYDLPEDRLYDVQNQVWYVPLPDGTVRAGFTPLSMTLAGDALVFTPKPAGKPFWQGKWFAMVECGKWIGAARAGFDGVMADHNEALVRRPALLNRDALGEGWMAALRPDRADWPEGLVTGAEVAPRFARWLAEESFRDRAD
ncbi:glycine cleavage system protein H [Enterovirga rhinocerotis]|uniref:Glycine cleavage system H protein n=1 Tax=Enterovirga rhinocerotis TaxID=1339210 RepID=A0A4R7C9I1_9HYPH|nr:glycine cleavage system protein H [Enterovirga rhinocerotis]TDR93407.1 glycine cleavage system H protein [Enterovirga rhinocerotis]